MNKTNYPLLLAALDEMQHKFMSKAKLSVLTEAQNVILTLESLLQKSIEQNEQLHKRCEKLEQDLYGKDKQ